MNIPRISFKVADYDNDRGNAWDFLLWLFCAVLTLALSALVVVIVSFWGYKIYQNATHVAPSKPFNAKREFVKSCNLRGYKYVVNVGSDDYTKWTCTKI